MKLEAIPFTCRVHLGEATCSLEAFSQLHVGDVLVLTQEASMPLTLSVSGIPLFKVVPGLEGMHKAVRIVETLL